MYKKSNAATIVQTRVIFVAFFKCVLCWLSTRPWRNPQFLLEAPRTVVVRIEESSPPLLPRFRWRNVTRSRTALIRFNQSHRQKGSRTGSSSCTCKGDQFFSILWALRAKINYLKTNVDARKSLIFFHSLNINHSAEILAKKSCD